MRVAETIAGSAPNFLPVSMALVLRGGQPLHHSPLWLAGCQKGVLCTCNNRYARTIRYICMHMCCIVHKGIDQVDTGGAYAECTGPHEFTSYLLGYIELEAKCA